MKSSRARKPKNRPSSLLSFDTESLVELELSFAERNLPEKISDDINVSDSFILLFEI